MPNYCYLSIDKILFKSLIYSSWHKPFVWNLFDFKSLSFRISAIFDTTQSFTH